MSPAAAVIVWGLGYSGLACLTALLLLFFGRRENLPPKTNAVLAMSYRLGLFAVAAGVAAHLLRLGEVS